MSAQPDTNAAVDFLRLVYPEGPWALTCISTDRKGIETETFYPTDEPAMREWLDRYNGDRNIYWHVNPVRQAVTRKAQREDIAAVAYLHVDIDPRAGEDLEEERRRALRLLENPPEGVPEPSIIIFSGGGYQGFWKLAEPIAIDGDLDRAEDAKRYNMQLELLFGADNCHNIDRIMRLPGTVNIPDAKKRKKGRTETTATLVDAPMTAYDLARFTAAKQVQNTEEGGFGGHTVQVSGNVPRLSDVHEIDQHCAPNQAVPDYAKVLIVQGTNPDEPTKYPSRSEALFACCCALVRVGVPDEIIFSVLTDPGFGISESVLEKGSNAEKYALRQIERAHEDAVAPELRELNERHAVIADYGGKCVVVSEIKDETTQRERLSPQSFTDFQNRYMNRQVRVGENANGDPKYMPLGKWWLQHPMRRQYDAVVFSPGRDPRGAYNLWRGFSVESRPGDCSLFLDHVRDNLCGGNEGYYRYLMGWMARAVQHPNRQGETAVVLRGKQGTGKSFFAKHFGYLFGRHFLQVSDPRHVVGNFNAHLRDCVVLFGDEAFWAGDKSHEGALKRLITEETLAIESKHVNTEASANYTHVILASNSAWVVPAGPEERRFFVLDVEEAQMQRSAYFAAINDQMKNGGYSALLYLLSNYDLTGYNVLAIPQTKALQEQKVLSYSSEEEWWFRKLVDGRLHPDHVDWQREVPRSVLQDDYILYTQRLGHTRRANDTALGRFLSRACPENWPKTKQRYKGPDNRPYHYEFPPLVACRAHWDDNFGGPFPWQTYAIEGDPNSSERLF